VSPTQDTGRVLVLGFSGQPSAGPVGVRLCVLSARLATATWPACRCSRPAATRARQLVRQSSSCMRRHPASERACGSKRLSARRLSARRRRRRHGGGWSDGQLLSTEDRPRRIAVRDGWINVRASIGQTTEECPRTCLIAHSSVAQTVSPQAVTADRFRTLKETDAPAPVFRPPAGSRVPPAPGHPLLGGVAINSRRIASPLWSGYGPARRISGAQGPTGQRPEAEC
jgi:hypothetical protein